MIHFACSECGKQHTARDSNAGRQGVCECGAVMTVPQTDQVPQNRSAGAVGDYANGDLRRSWYIAIGGGIIGASIIALVVYMLFFHNTWESDNGSRLLSLKSEAEALVRTQDYEKAKAKYEELFGLLANRIPASGFLKSEMQDARVAYAENNKKVEPIVAARAETARAEAARKAADAAREQPQYLTGNLDRTYTDKQGNQFSKGEADRLLSDIQRGIARERNPYKRAYLEGQEQAVREEYDRIRREQGN